MTHATTAAGPIVVSGAAGLIGTLLTHALRAARRPLWLGARVGAAEAHRIDLAATPQDWELPADPSLAFLCAAVTGIDACRRDPAGSRRINVDGTVALAQELVRRGAFVVYLSSSAVFSGEEAYPDEASQVSPSTEYGRQKAEAESRLRELGGVAIVRPTKIIAPSVALFAGWRDELAAGRPVQAFADMPLAPLSPTYVIPALLRIGQLGRPGIFHLSASEDLVFADIAVDIATRLGVSPTLVEAVSCRTFLSRQGLPPARHAALGTPLTQTLTGLLPPPPSDALAALP